MSKKPAYEELEQRIKALEESAIEARLVQKALQENEKKYRQLAETAHDIIVTADLNFKITYVNKATLNFTGGIDPVGMSILDFTPHHSHQLQVERMQQRREGFSGVWAFEWEIIHPSGNIAIFDTRSTLLTENGKPSGVMYAIRDITERKKAEEAMQESEERYRLLFEEAIEGIFRTNMDGRAIMINSAMAQMLGYDSPQDAVEKTTDIGSQIYADPEERKALIGRLMREGKITGSEVLFKRTDGSTLKVMLNFRLVHDKSGAPALIEGSCIDITDNWLAEEALKTSEEKYRKIFEDAIEGIYQTTPDGRYLNMNPAFARMFGYASPQEMIDSVTNSSHQLYVNPQDREEIVRMLHEQDKVEGGEVEVFHRDGSRFWISFNIHAVRDTSGEILYFDGTNMDITKRKKTEEALRESEMLYTSLVNTIPDVILRTDVNGKITFVNDRTLEISGYSWAEIESRDILLFVSPKDRDRMVQSLSLMMEGGLGPQEYQMIMKDGREISFEVNGDLSRNKDGMPYGTVHVCRDVTERQEASASLLASKIRYQSILENTGTVMLIVDEDMTISFANAEFEKLTGYSREEAMGSKKWTEFVDKSDLQRMVGQHALRRSEAGLAKRSYEFCLLHKDGDLRQVYLTVDLIPGTSNSVASLLDITELKRSESIMTTQRDLGIALAKSTSLQDALNLCLDAAIKATGFDAGGIYIIDPGSRNFHLACVRGVSDRFADRVSHYASSSGRAQFVIQGNPLYIEGVDELVAYNEDDIISEGIKSVAAIPIKSQDKVIGSLNLASHVFDLIPDYSRNALETIASQVGTSIARAQTEESLRESEGKFRDLAEKSMVGIYLIQDDLFKYVNTEFANILGYSTEEIIDRMGAKDVIFPDDLPLVEDRLRKRISGEIKSLRYEFRIWRKDREIRHAEVYSSRTIYQGKPAVIGTILDITDRRKTEEELRRLSIAIEQAAEDIIITSPEGVIEYVNPAFEKITGYARGEAIGQNPRIMKSGVHGPAFYEHLWNTIRAGNIWSGRITNRCKDGKLIQEDATISPLLTSAGKLTGYVALKRDVTEAVKLETHLRQAQKMEAIGTLAGGIAHDFNNILGAMMGYAELAKFKTVDVKIYPYLEQILKACDRSRDLVQQILTFSRRREQEKKPVAVTPIVKEALRLLRSSLPSTVEIRQLYNARHDTVLADPTQMHQVLMNLCTNAVHAMREREGVLEVRLAQDVLSADNPAYHPELKEGAYLQLVVSDTGDGIDPAVKDKIFDPFFTTKEPGEGTGLGLSVVYGIVKDHGGIIFVESELGKGTVFTIHLPLIAADGKLEGQEIISIPNGKGCILYVDDEEPIAAMGQDMLTSLGYDVTVRFSSRDALEAFRAHPERFDLVITDMTMPNMTGSNLAREILKIRPGLPIILTTGFSERINEEEAKKIGIREFLMKPVSFSGLALAVKRIMDQEES
ncbi:MAG: PAS domain S-box protein [Syntrophus sp. (in: bacteria)]